MPQSTRAQTVRAFAAAFTTCDIDTIIDCVNEDLVWEFNGEKAGQGRASLEERMRADLAQGRAEVTIEQLIEEGDTLVALNRGRFVPQHGVPMAYVSAEVYTFTGDKISRMRTYQPMS
ncbi:nuclear transport factor 2 family protein [Saccharopolyspora rhizosphaerae]|uniref:Nuclear transport factor 2 family protein n=1 Tax=Saccharopolyspora rhizosphaerae TaxID=2492662 RepID=A0A3R8Q8G0_9PSEU|nr:nuclear transport factor 2 family protein [Saccharopolyspora rhizosphaerae]RRO19262.1 nuclear transport factor 2 family protein [Saccharopolyspora rhizosphaerae]